MLEKKLKSLEGKVHNLNSTVLINIYEKIGRIRQLREKNYLRKTLQRI